MKKHQKVTLLKMRPILEFYIFGRDSVIGAPVVKSQLGCLPPIGKSLWEPLLLESRPKLEVFKIVRNHLGPTQEHPGGVLDDSGAVFLTPGSRSDLVLLVKRRIQRF